MRISILAVFFLFFFFSDKHKLKGVRCMQILYIPNHCSTTLHLPFLVWGGIRARTVKLWPQSCLQRCIFLLFGHLFGLLHNKCTCIHVHRRLLGVCCYLALSVADVAPYLFPKMHFVPVWTLI